jgi:DNA-binding SARP family transcriptional activator
VRFYVLGGLEVTGPDGRPAVLGSPKQRALLGMLLLERNQPVPVERIVAGLWGNRPPASARKNLQTYVWGLRRVLAEQVAEDAEYAEVGTPEPGRRGGSEHRLERSRAGYRLVVPDTAVDLYWFERFLADGQRLLATGHPDAAAQLRAALQLWRGEPLAGVPLSASLRAELHWLTERYLAAVEDRIEADLAAGEHRRLVPELRQLAVRHPLRERLHGQLMIALYRCGRAGDALAVYSATRLVLQAEMGLEPGPALRQLQRLILSGSPTLDLLGRGYGSAEGAGDQAEAHAGGGEYRGGPGDVPVHAGHRELDGDAGGGEADEPGGRRGPAAEPQRGGQRGEHERQEAGQPEQALFRQDQQVLVVRGQQLDALIAGAIGDVPAGGQAEPGVGVPVGGEVLDPDAGQRVRPPDCQRGRPELVAVPDGLVGVGARGGRGGQPAADDRVARAAE